MSILEGNKIVVGAGPYRNNPGWLHTDMEELNLLHESTWSRFSLSSIQAILAEHVWEHLTYEEGIEAARRCKKYLQPGGYIRCAVPDGFFQNEAYQKVIQIGGPGPKDHPAASHKVVYNYLTLRALFKSVGYLVRLLEYCDEEGVFHHHDWNGGDGVIFRSKKFDPRNEKEMVFPSLIVDAVNPELESSAL